MKTTDADSREAAFQAQLDALRRDYLQSLPARLEALVEAWRGCVDAGDEAPWLALRSVAHKLAGSASSYGFEAMGQAARELDRLLSGRPPCRVRARTESMVVRLLAALEAVITSE